MIGERLVCAFGEVKSISDWSRDKRCSVSYKTVYARLVHLDWMPEAAISTPRLRLGSPDHRRQRGLSQHSETLLREAAIADIDVGF